MPTLAILVAAGRGERMGAQRPKAFLELAGQSLLRRAADTFAPLVDALIAVVPVDAVEEGRGLLAGVSRVHAVVAGGATRADSVRAGLQAAPPGFEGIVLVHDAARPLVERATIEAVRRAAEQTGAALPVLPLVDTIKRVREGRVTDTLDRSALGAAQTPQGFRLRLLVQACEAARRDGVVPTDEAMAVERLGHPVAVVPGSPRNLKITTPQDLVWAAAILAAEKAGE